MTFTEKHIVESYASLFAGFSTTTKTVLIESLSKSLKSEKKAKENTFYKSFGALASDKGFEESLSKIKSNKKFRRKEIKF